MPYKTIIEYRLYILQIFTHSVLTTSDLYQEISRRLLPAESGGMEYLSKFPLHTTVNGLWHGLSA